MEEEVLDRSCRGAEGDSGNGVQGVGPVTVGAVSVLFIVMGGVGGDGSYVQRPLKWSWVYFWLGKQPECGKA